MVDTFFVFPSLIFAKISLSEFQIEPISEQWVELYNEATESANVTGWIIDDSGGSEKFIVDGEEIAGLSYRVFYSGKLNFNKTADSVNLFDNTNNLLESFSYSQSPGENVSFGKMADGVWGICQPTPEKSNNCQTPSPTPTLTPTPSPTVTPTTTSKPTFTVTISPSNTPTSTISPTVRLTEKTRPSEKITTPLVSSSRPKVLSEATMPAHKPVQEEINGKKEILLKLGVLTGTLLIAGSLVLFYTARHAGDR